ncbi:MAG: metal ABC transporter solute-binding protein, Zn/Mn family [Candidatus Hydrogenedentota bacterium]
MRPSVSGLLALTVIGAVMAAGCGVSLQDSETSVVAGSSHIEVILEDLAGDWVTVRSLFPPALCPSQFDMKPSHINALRTSEAVLLHPWQEAMGNVQEGLRTARTPEEQVHILAIEGNWMTPEAQRAATERVAELLEPIKPANSASENGELSERLAERLALIEEKAMDVREALDAAGADGVAVLCNEMQADFLEWAGFEIAGTYGAPEDLSVAAIERLLAQGKEAGVLLVVDNLQSGDSGVGARMARELDAGHAVLTNFPRAVPETSTWEATLEYNITQLTGVLEDANS